MSDASFAPWQQRVYAQAVAAFAAGRLGHGLLLCGPEKLGKRDVCLRCASGERKRADVVCVLKRRGSTCLAIDGARHPGNCVGQVSPMEFGHADKTEPMFEVWIAGTEPYRSFNRWDRFVWPAKLDSRQAKLRVSGRKVRIDGDHLLECLVSRLGALLKPQQKAERMMSQHVVGIGRQQRDDYSFRTPGVFRRRSAPAIQQ